MMMKYLFCEPSASLEEFAAHRKKMNRYFTLIVVLGLLTILLVTLILPRYVTVQGAKMEFFFGLYTGVGIGLMLCGVILMARNRKMMASPEALKRARCEVEDERTREIASRATRCAAFVMLIVLYLVMLVAGAMDMFVFWVCFAMLLLFGVLIFAFVAYFSRKI